MSNDDESANKRSTVVLPKTDYDPLLVETQQFEAQQSADATSKPKRLRRPNRKPTFPKTIQIHLRNAVDATKLAELLQRPLKADAASRRIIFRAKYDTKHKIIIQGQRFRQSQWKFFENGLRKYRPRKNRTWNTDWFFRQHWIGMVPFAQERESPWLTYRVTFENEIHYANFLRLIKQTLSLNTKSTWFPVKEAMDYTKEWWVSADGKRNQPRYPIFVVSKGRAHEQMTMRTLSKMGLKYFVMVEPQEAELYRRLAPYPNDVTFLELPVGNHGNGPGLARNACWDYAKHVLKAKRFFVLDDNIDGFYRLHENKRYRCGDGTPFRALEDFVDRYKNVPLAGFQYRFFKAPDHKHYPFTVNTRIYSAALVATADERFKQRGRYNEDTIQSIDVMKADLATIEFNCFLSGKIATQTMKGGNTDAFYAPQGKRNPANSTKEKSEMLVATHKGAAKVIFAYGRWHHKSNYKKYRGNALKRTAAWIKRLRSIDRKSAKLSNILDAYKMKLVSIPTSDY